MIVHGREIKFRRTVLATCEIADVCPDKDISRFGELASADYVSSQKAAAQFVVALNRGYEMNQKYEDPGHEERPLTLEEVMLLDNDDFNTLFQDALKAFEQGGKTTVETEEPKGKNGARDSE